MELTGGCLCGAVRFRVKAKPFAAYYCHCTMCQRTGGGPFMVGATVPIEVFAFTKGKPMAYESSSGFVRLACGKCGSALGMQAKDNPKLADFPLGCLDDPNELQPNFHMHTDSQVGWCRVTDDLPRHPKGAPELDNLWAELDGWTAPE